MQAFLAIFAFIFVAELPDKTALASIVLASRMPALPVFVGACAAFLVHGIIAVTAGTLLSNLPHEPVRIGAGVIFIVCAVLMWRRDSDDDDEALEGEHRHFLRTALASFTLIFIAEWGDLTQFAMAALAAQDGRPLLVLSASVLALWAVSAVGVLIGSRMRKWLDPLLVQRIAAVVFAIVGVLLIVSPGTS